MHCTSCSLLLKKTLESKKGVFEETNKSQLGTGGIGSKLMAAGLALGYGVEAYIGKLSEENGIQDILSGRAGTKIIQ
jgi:glutamate 5-kinase